MPEGQAANEQASQIQTTFLDRFFLEKALIDFKNYITNGHRKEWLTVVENGNTAVSVPTANLYQEIYEKPAVPKPVVANHNPSGNRFWGLVDPDLLDPAGNSGRACTPSANQPNSILDAAAPPSGGTPFDAFLKELKKAERFHDDLHLSRHARPFVVRATGEKTVDAVQFKVRKGSASEDVYESHGFRGHFTNGTGEYNVAEIQEAAGRGDGTVSAESAKVFHSPTWDYEAKHQDVFKSSKIQEWAFESIVSLCKVQYEERRGSSAAQQQVRP